MAIGAVKANLKSLEPEKVKKGKISITKKTSLRVALRFGLGPSTCKEQVYFIYRN
jgi:hypothetical protein